MHLTRLAEGDGIEHEAARREYRRLAALFRVEFASFERKRYENLSHEVNKAMNLNSYLALMGKSYREMRDPKGHGARIARGRRRGTIDVPDAELVLTLDADSVLVPDYALRLEHVMRHARQRARGRRADALQRVSRRAGGRGTGSPGRPRTSSI